MSKPKPDRKRSSRKSGNRFPWLLFLILIGTLYVFWVLPHQLGPRPVSVEFETPGTTAE